MEFPLSYEEKKVILDGFGKFFNAGYCVQCEANEVISNLKSFLPELINIFTSKIKPAINENPGILQKDFYTNLKDDKKQELSFIFYCLGGLGLITRKKRSGSYEISVVDNINEEEIINLYKINYFNNSTTVEKYFIEFCYPDSAKRIIDYFGRENLIFLFQLDSAYSNYFLRLNIEAKKNEGLEVPFWFASTQNIECNKMFTSTDDNYYSMDFLSNIGGCLNFEMNDALKNIINKYWTGQCEEYFRNFLVKYGFFSDRLFLEYKLSDLIGKDRMAEMFSEMEEKSEFIKVNWCGGLSVNTRNLIWYYIQSLKFQWGIKPRIFLNKCIYCGENFYPCYNLDWSFSSEKLFNFLDGYLKDRTIEELNFCSKHFPPLIITKYLNGNARKHFFRVMKNDLVEIRNILGYDLPRMFRSNLNYLEDLEQEKLDDLIKIMNIISSKYFENEITQEKKENDVVEQARKDDFLNVLISKANEQLGSKQAIDILDKALELGAQPLKIYLARSKAYYEIGEFDRSIEDANKVINLELTYIEAYSCRLKALIAKGLFDDAISEIKTILELNPRYISAYVDRANIYKAQGDSEKMISDLNTAINLESEGYSESIAEAYIIRGNYYFEKKEFDKAASDFYHIVRRCDDSCQYARCLLKNGIALTYVGEFNKAVRSFNKAMDVSIDLDKTEIKAEAYYWRGFCRFMQQKYKESWKDICKAKELGCNLEDDFVIELKDSFNK